MAAEITLVDVTVIIYENGLLNKILRNSIANIDYVVNVIRNEGKRV